FASADRSTGEQVDLAYAATPLPTTTTTTTAPPDEIDLADYPSEAPDGLVQGIVCEKLTVQGADPRAANCTHEQLLAATPEQEVTSLATADPDALFELVAEAARTCTVPEDVIQAAVDAGL